MWKKEIELNYNLFLWISLSDSLSQVLKAKNIVLMPFYLITFAFHKFFFRFHFKQQKNKHYIIRMSVFAQKKSSSALCIIKSLIWCWCVWRYE